jgi:hypothetical protein
MRDRGGELQEARWTHEVVYHRLPLSADVCIGSRAFLFAKLYSPVVFMRSTSVAP